MRYSGWFRENFSPVASAPQTPILSALSVLRRYRLLVIGFPIIVALTVAARSIIRGPRFAATTRFAPQGTGTDASRLIGLAAQFGVGVPRGGAEGSVDFYAQLVRSGDLLRAVALTRYPNSPADSARALTLVDTYGVRGATSEQRVQRTIDLLRDLVTASVDVKANLVTVVVASPRSDLAVAIARRILDLVNEFNLRKRQSQAEAEASFVNARLKEAQGELNSAENDLSHFLETNREIRNSPSLIVEQSRLQRQVDLRQQLFTSLAQALDQARIDQVRNTPVITVVDNPEGSERRTDHLLLDTCLALIPAFVFAVTSAFGIEYLRRELRPSSQDRRGDETNAPHFADGSERAVSRLG